MLYGWVRPDSAPNIVTFYLAFVTISVLSKVILSETLIKENQTSNNPKDISQPDMDWSHNLLSKSVSAKLQNQIGNVNENDKNTSTIFAYQSENGEKIGEDLAQSGVKLQPDPIINQEADKTENKSLAVVSKCCPVGQNFSTTLVNGTRSCETTVLTFRPYFYESNETHMWQFVSNQFETIVGNPCAHEKYKLDPEQSSADEFYLFKNGTIFAPFHTPMYLGVKDYCMETFSNDSSLTGETRPLVCFKVTKTASNTLIFYAAGLLISVPLLIITALVYLCIAELRDSHGLSLACHAICLALAFSCLAATQLSGQNFSYVACRVIAFLIQFSFVSCFFWLNVMCFDTWINVRRYLLTGSSKRCQKRRFIYYSIYAVSFPLALLVVTLVMDLSPAVPSTYIKPNFGAVGCWFKTDQAALPYFYGPVACILLANVIIFFLTSRAFAKHYDKLTNFTATDLATTSFGSSQDWLRLSEVLDAAILVREVVPNGISSPQISLRHNNFKQRWHKYRKLFRLCCILSFVMGLSWIIEVLSWAVGGDEGLSIWLVFDVINSLQGVVIFCIFVLQKRVRHLTWKKIKLNILKCNRRDENLDSMMSEQNPNGRQAS